MVVSFIIDTIKFTPKYGAFLIYFKRMKCIKLRINPKYDIIINNIAGTCPDNKYDQSIVYEVIIL